MNGNWLIVLAAESQFPADGDLEKLPAIPSETVAKALERCPFLRRDGFSFHTTLLEPFEFSAHGVRYLALAEVGELLTIARIAEALAIAVGPVTILDDDYGTRAEVKVGMSPETIAAKLQDLRPSTERSDRLCWKCGGTLPPDSLRCPTCGWEALPAAGRRSTRRRSRPDGRRSASFLR